MRTRRFLAALALPLALVSACGEDAAPTAADPAPTSASASASPSDAMEPSKSAVAGTPAPAGMQTCVAIWKAGSQLPRVYKGCAQEGALVAADTLSCSSGQAIVRYDGHYFGVAGGTIYRADNLNRDDRYLEMVGSCRG
jgi:hypothetical protein